MSETTADKARTPAERCPFCHDALGPEGEPGDTRVACGGCSAPHHAECFVENGGCAATGCGAKEAKVAGREGTLPVGVIAAEVTGGTLRGDGRPPLLLLAFVTLAAFLGFVGFVVGGALSIVAFVALGILTVIALLLKLAPDLPEARVAEEGEPLTEPDNPVVRHAAGQLWGPSPFEAVKARIDAEEKRPEDELAPLPPGTRAPARCPACSRDLVQDEDDEPLRFCYHCGAALGGDARGAASP